MGFLAVGDERVASLVEDEEAFPHFGTQEMPYVPLRI